MHALLALLAVAICSGSLFGICGSIVDFGPLVPFFLFFLVASIFFVLWALDGEAPGDLFLVVVLEFDFFGAEKLGHVVYK
jgi:hypothetical protein